MSDAMPDKFDRQLGSLTGLPDTLHTKPSTLRVVPPMGVGGSSLFVLQTFRQQTRNDEGKVTSSADTVFLEIVDDEGSKRIVIPPAVADAIARQRDALSNKTRKAGAKQAAATRKSLGIVPHFKKATK